jgi:4-hydroxythreonine-4-phosphate dehydrogenase
MLAARHARAPFPARLVLVGDRALLAERAARIGLTLPLTDFDPAAFAPHGAVEVWHMPLIVPAVPGQPDPTNAQAVLTMLRHAVDACATGAFDAMVTSPVQKSAILDAGVPFTGHTEFIAERTATPRVVMCLVHEAPRPLRVALVTTHLPLSAVPAAITFDAVAETLVIVDRALRAHFRIADPRLAVCGLNPHAGERGYLGREEIDVIAPAIAAARAHGVDADGPLPADTAFVPQHAAGYDAIVAMYHDQGLPVLKAASFGGGVNVTLGLPFVRTSVDHGTALDLARDADAARTADPGSLVAAVELAIRLSGTT